jgi:hypothetical protein
MVVVATAAFAACTDDADDAAPGAVRTDVSEATAADTAAGVAEPELRLELLAMMEEDQAEQTGEQATNNYAARTARLAAILEQHGWPSIALVGEDGSTAAWVIAQHADLDVDLQRRALQLLRAAAEDGQASRGDLAYLTDRVATATGSDQLFGTQMRCDEQQVPVPATPIADEATVDERRDAAGLPPLQDYLDEMAAVCAGDG